MGTLPALRQIVLLTGDLSAALAETKAFLGLRTGIRDEAGMAALGFEHEVLAINDTFVEIVAPLSPDSSPGRLLARRGEGGYMVVLQVADVDAMVDRASGIGLSPILREVFEGNPMTQWHPRDLGTLAEIDEMRVAEWHFGTALSDTGCTEVVEDIISAVLAVPDPVEYARRWATLLGIQLPSGRAQPEPLFGGGEHGQRSTGAATRIPLGERELRFVPDDRAKGLCAVTLAASHPHPPAAPPRATICGVEFSIVTGSG